MIYPASRGIITGQVYQTEIDVQCQPWETRASLEKPSRQPKHAEIRTTPSPRPGSNYLPARPKLHSCKHSSAVAEGESKAMRTDIPLRAMQKGPGFSNKLVANTHSKRQLYKHWSPSLFKARYLAWCMLTPCQRADAEPNMTGRAGWQRWCPPGPPRPPPVSTVGTA